MIKKFLLLAIVIPCLLSLFCETNPQRSGWISFQAFSNMDHIATVFESIDEKIPITNQTVTVDGVAYSMNNFTLGAWYNSGAQTELFLNESSAKVTCGVLTISYQFNYAVAGGKSGTAYGLVAAESFGFNKSLYLNNGALAWDLVSLDTITILKQRTIKNSSPALSDADKKVFEDLLNDRTTNKSTSLSQSLQQLNTYFKEDLKQFLEGENIVVVNNQDYIYANVTLTYTSVVKDQKLSNVGFKGLYYTCLFQLENYTTACVDLPTQYTQDYGGLQQMIAFPWLDANLLYLAKNNYFTMNLSARAWQSDLFQFYMGDVANVIDFATNIMPSTPVTIGCSWQSDKQSDTFVQYFTLSSIYTSVPLQCVVAFGSVTVQTIKFNLINVLDLKLGTSHLNVKVKQVRTQKITYEPSGNYVVTKPDLANQLVYSVANTLLGKATFGNGFQTTERKAPSLTIRRNYLVMFDSSEV